MLRLENPSIEHDALSGEAYIAIPIEIYQNAAGEISLTTYAACQKIANTFLSAFSTDPFQKEALSWLAACIAPFMEDCGYQYDATASGVILEYTADQLARQMPQTDAILIENMDEWLQYKNKTDAAPDFAKDGKGAAFAVVEDNEIISCACTNDAFYADGAVEIYVETASGHRNKGLGYTCAAALISHLSWQGYKIWYKCYEENSASAAIARKCGLWYTGKRVSFVCYANA